MYITLSLLDHAAYAVSRGRRALDELKQKIAPHCNATSLYRYGAAAVVADLDRHFATVMNAYREMEKDDQNALLFRRFLVCHDDFLEAMRNGKCTLARDEGACGAVIEQDLAAVA